MANHKWTLSKDSDNTFVHVEGKKRIVKKLSPSSAIHVMEVFLGDDSVPVELDLTSFKSSDNSFSKRFQECGLSRTKFDAKWREYGHENEKTSSQNLEVFSGEADLFGDENGSQNLITSLQNIQTVSDVRTEEIKQHELGVYDVHLDNLIQPSKENEVRPIMYDHVKVLEDSFLQNEMNQLTVLVGMLAGKEQLTEYSSAGTCKIEVIGGNHTVCALKNLFHKGLCQSTVKVKLYRGMTSIIALTLGLRHNLVHDKSRPMTFMETVKFIRGLVPNANMEPADVKVWKREIQTAFGDKTVEKLEGRMQNHIALARVSADVFNLIVKADEELGSNFNQTFFKGMLSLPKELQIQCMNTLISEGSTRFRRKVKEGLVLHPKKKRAKKGKIEKECFDDQSVQEDENNDDIGSNEEVRIETTNAMKEEMERMRQELDEARRALDELNPNKRRKTGSSKEIQVGDQVNAKWKDGVAYDAVVKKIEMVYHVEYLLDGVKAKLTEDNIST